MPPLTPMEQDNEIKMPYDFTERENGIDGMPENPLETSEMKEEIEQLKENVREEEA